MQRDRRTKDSARIDYTCCGHEDGRRTYLTGYVGLPICRTAMCLCCGVRQVICGRFGEKIYPVMNRLFRGRFMVTGEVEMGEDNNE